MIPTLIIIGLAFIRLGYETDWMRVRLLVGPHAPVIEQPNPQWLEQFNIRKERFIAPLDYSSSPNAKKGYIVYQTFINRTSDARHKYLIQLSPNTNSLVSKQWLDEHWNDLADYHPTVELYFGNGYRQTFTLKKPELIKQIIKINTGKKYFEQLATI